MPTWSRDGRELIYLAEGARILMVAECNVKGDSFRAETPRVWSPGVVPLRAGGRLVDLHPDGERVAVLRSSGDQARRDHVVLIQNFFDELRRIAPVSR